jgi:hypothetical protein
MALLDRARPGMLVGYVLTIAGYCWFAAGGGSAAPLPILVMAAGFAVALAGFLCYDAAQADSEPDGAAGPAGARRGGGAAEDLLRLGSSGQRSAGTEFPAQPTDLAASTDGDLVDDAPPQRFRNRWSRRFDADSDFFFGPN